MDTLLIPTDKAINTIDEAINAIPDKQYTSLTHTLMNEFIIRKDDDTYTTNDNSVWCTMEQAANSSFDASLLKAIHEQRNKRALFVHTGALHSQKLATLLPNAGFEVKTACINQIDDTRSTVEACEDMKLLSEKSAERAVDVKAFLAQCKTLPKNQS